MRGDVIEDLLKRSGTNARVLVSKLLHSRHGPRFPRAGLDEERDTLVRWSERKGEAGLAAYQAGNNVVSIDGLPTGLVDA